MRCSLGISNFLEVGSQETPEVTGKFGLGVWNEAGQSLIEFCQENALVIANTLFQQHKRRLFTRVLDITTWSTRVRNAVLGYNLKKDKMISVRFQGKPFNITVIQSMPQPVMLKKLKLNSSLKTYKTFYN